MNHSKQPQFEEWSKKTSANVLLWALGYAVIIATQYYYEDSLFRWSGQEIVNEQKGLSDTDWQFWDHYTNIGGGLLQGIYMLIFVVFWPNETESVILTVNFSIQMFWMNLLKIFHKQPRPFWEYPDVRAAACYT